MTAIHEADADGNRRTAADPAWQPLRTTPPIPDHASAHAVEGAAAAEVFRRFFGTDRMSFDSCSTTLPERTCADPDPVTRRWSSFSQAARENADSRVWIGFHFRRATEVGMNQGTSIGRIVVRSALRRCADARPPRPLPSLRLRGRSRTSPSTQTHGHARARLGCGRGAPGRVRPQRT